MKETTEQGLQHFADHRFAEAEPHLQRAVDLKPDEERNQYFLGVCLHEQKKYAQAEPHLQRAVDLKPDDELNQYFLGLCLH